MSNFTSLVMVAVLIVVGGSEAKNIAANGKFVMRPVIGGFALGVFLFVFGLADENLASKFAILAIVAGLLVNGKDIFQTLNPSK